MVMKLASTRAVFAYWDACRRGRAAPDREDIEPGRIRHALGDTFMLDLEAGCGHPFRLAGTRVCALFGRELKGAPFFPLWADPGLVRDLVATLTEDTTGVVSRVAGGNAQGDLLGLEMLLLPLASSGRIPARLLGVLAPLTQPWWLAARPLSGLRLESLRFVGGAADRPQAPLFVAPTRPVLVVHEGGRAAGDARRQG
jgi:hypothetical protein